MDYRILQHDYDNPQPQYEAQYAYLVNIGHMNSVVTAENLQAAINLATEFYFEVYGPSRNPKFDPADGYHDLIFAGPLNQCGDLIGQHHEHPDVILFGPRQKAAKPPKRDIRQIKPKRRKKPGPKKGFKRVNPGSLVLDKI